MSFLKRMISGGEGKSSPTPQERAAEELRQSIEVICNRATTASFLEDRKAACMALKSIAKHHPTEVGMVSISTLISLIKKDFDDVEMIKVISETFIAICNDNVDLRREFGELLLKDLEVSRILLDVLSQETGQYLRFSIIQLLALLEGLLSQRVAECILACPNGLSTLLNLLEDEHDIIRVEAIALICNLTSTSMEIQKMAVFEGAFERLFEIIFTEEGVFGGDAIVQDALLICQNLLQHNPSNQKYFCESPCFKKLTLLLTASENSPSSPNTKIKFEEKTTRWNSSVIQAFIDAVKIPCILLYRDNPQLKEIQDNLAKIGIFDVCIKWIFDSTVPSDSKGALLKLMEMLLWYNGQIQQRFSRHVFINEKGHSVPAVLAAIKMAINNGNFIIRLLTSEMIASFLEENEENQLAIAATFKSPRLSGSPDIDDQSAGSILVEQCLDLEEVKKDQHYTWFPSVIMAHILRNNPQCKKLAAEHQILTEDDNEAGASPTFFFQVVVEKFITSSKVPKLLESAKGYLILLTVLVHDSGHLAKLLLETPLISYLIELISQNSSANPTIQGYSAFLFGFITLFLDDSASVGSFTRNTLIDIVKTRISYDVFSARIIRTRDSLNTSLVTQKEDQAIDRRYAELFVHVYDDILKLFHGQHQNKHRRSSVHKPVLLDKSVETDMEVVTEGHFSHWDLLEGDSVELPAETNGSLSKNLESKCAYLQMENMRLQKTIEAYTTQMLQIEQDHEELLITLASYDNELKQLKETLQSADNTHLPFSVNESSSVTPSSPQAQIATIATEVTTDPTSAKSRFGSILNDPSPSSHTFDV